MSEPTLEDFPVEPEEGVTSPEDLVLTEIPPSSETDPDVPEPLQEVLPDGVSD